MSFETKETVTLKKTSIFAGIFMAAFMFLILFCILKQISKTNAILESLRQATADIKEVTDDVGRINGTVKVKK